MRKLHISVDILVEIILLTLTCLIWRAEEKMPELIHDKFPFCDWQWRAYRVWVTTSDKWSVFAYWVKNVSEGKSVKTDID